MYKFEAVSNIAYFFAGLYLFMFQGMVLPFLLLTYLSFGSYIAHAIGGHWWKWDWSAMLVMFLGTICFSLNAVNPYTLVGIIGLGYWATTSFDQDFPHSYTIIGTLFFVSLFTSKGDKWMALLMFGIGFVFWLLGKKYDTTDNDILHGIWHFFTALGFIYLFA